MTQLNSTVNTFDSTLEFGGLLSGIKLGEPVHLFDRIDLKQD